MPNAGRAWRSLERLALCDARAKFPAMNVWAGAGMIVQNKVPSNVFVPLRLDEIFDQLELVRRRHGGVAGSTWLAF